MRVEFSMEGCNLYGRPSAGGVWRTIRADLPDLDFLGLDRFTPVKSSRNTNEGVEFARKLQMLGAEFREHENRRSCDRMIDVPFETQITRRIGWPQSGGVLVLGYEKYEDK